MEGVGPPLVTPFTDDGDVDHGALSDLVGWVEDRGVDFVVVCGSSGEAELLTAAERAAVVETTVEAASVPVVAGTGSPGYRETLAATEDAAAAGADAALVVTPFYYDHGDDALLEYYRELADAAPLPIYLYSVPGYTGVSFDPGTVGTLADHPNVAGIKDSSGDLARFLQTVDRTAGADFDPMTGSGSVFAQALEVGATGGVLALADVAPEAAVGIYDRATRDGDGTAARSLNADLVDLDRAVTVEYGIPGLKHAMRLRGAPAGHPRSPHRSLGPGARSRIESLVSDLG
jgi:dihydrodipicolinate synthase/N-acetylneuraminate lyase